MNTFLLLKKKEKKNLVHEGIKRAPLECSFRTKTCGSIRRDENPFCPAVFGPELLFAKHFVRKTVCFFNLNCRSKRTLIFSIFLCSVSFFFSFFSLITVSVSVYGLHVIYLFNLFFILFLSIHESRLHIQIPRVRRHNVTRVVSFKFVIICRSSERTEIDEGFETATAKGP